MATGKRPTIVDVAAHAKVSKSTVSLVLQNSPLVRKETRKAVNASMVALGYVRNRAAATLRGSGTGLVGLIINDLRNPFFTEFAASVQMALAERGFATVIANCDEDPETQTRTIGTMLEHDVAGLVISPCYGDADKGFKAIERAGIPALQVLRDTQSNTAPLPFFSHDYASGSRMAVRHLLDQGIDRIAFVGGVQGRNITAERMSGYLAEMQAATLPTTILHGPSTRAFGRLAVEKLLAEHPEVEAAICFNDLVALGVHAGLSQAGKMPGRDFFLIGFDDIEEARLVYPPLSTIRCDVGRFGAMAAGILYEMIRNDAASETPDRLAVELIVRASSTRI
ncbi:LacI family DNA-binding transcriptional regulator [uncultured Roseobacter sp.]|uniref:LacI family DNA-binding transcriptional regulator n=1 Tax=uncultured Roseobacter sp. TaxID=114847 RepID=UPI00262190BA|nr:LacI family DNA-binding transcriptional regulator [uncultured Roseobacter sp.]